jgi:sporulation protein YlmC with PRC-barrel domain
MGGAYLPGTRYTVSMLQLSGALQNKPVMSLRTGTQVAVASAPIFNPNNLKVEGFYCTDRFEKKQLVLLYQDIRDIIPQGFVVDDHDVLVDADELIRLKDVMKLSFELIGKQVETVSKHKVGKVSDYATETTTMYVQKIYVSQSLLKSFTGGSLSIDRNQIVEITNRRIIINDLVQPTPAPATVPTALA